MNEFKKLKNQIFGKDKKQDPCKHTNKTSSKQGVYCSDCGKKL